MKMSTLSISALTLVGAIACGRISTQASRVYEAWNERNDPDRLNPNADRNVHGQLYLKRLNELPTKGELEKKPWSDTFWPSQIGGIAARWNSVDPMPFTYRSPTADEVRAMSLDELAQLSPAEKYDIYVGNYEYPTVKKEWQRNSPHSQDWSGICQGWAAASLIFDEPLPVILKGAGGTQVPFGSSDVGALLAYYQAVDQVVPYRSLGQRCEETGANWPTHESPLSECRDTNAGSFHIVLTNKIGILKEGLLGDLTPTDAVWNYPIRAYSSQITGYQEPTAGAAPGTVREALVTTEMVYVDKTSAHWNSLRTTNINTERTEIYSYRLELNQNGDIIGGQWLNGNHPDIMWTQRKPEFKGYYARIGEIYEASRKSTPTLEIPPRGSPQPAGTSTPVPPELTPAPEPTLTPAPEPTPSEPIVTSVGFPEAWCPEGFAVVQFNAAGARICAKEQTVVGPFPAKMMDACLAQFAPSACNTLRWSLLAVKAVYGQSRCPRGSLLDSRTGYCAEGPADTHGPFTPELVAKCENFGGGNTCRTMRWSRKFLESLMRHIPSP